MFAPFHIRCNFHRKVRGGFEYANIEASKERMREKG